MTKEEIMATYGDVPLRFKHYYKYSFNFEGVAPDGAIVGLSVGGDAGAIYRYSVSPEKVETLKNDNWHAAAVDKDKTNIWNEYR